MEAGFNAVIGNPPYVSNWELTAVDENLPHRLENLYSDVTYGHWDLFVPFVSRGLSLVSPSGHQAFITPNSLATEKYGKRIREELVKNYTIRKIVQFRDHSVFNDVDRQYLIYIATPSEVVPGLCEIIKFENDEFVKEDEVDPGIFLEYSNSTFRLDVAQSDRNIKRKIESESTSLGHLCIVNPGVVAHSASDSPLDFKKADVIGDEPHEGWKKYISGGDVHRHRVEWQGKYMDYDSRRKHFHRPKYPELFESPKIMFSGISGEGSKIRSCYDEERYYTNHNVLHAPLWREEISQYHSSQDYEIADNVREYDLRYISGIVNSRLINYYFKCFLATGTLQGSYSSIYPEDVRKLPVHDVDFDDRYQIEPYISDEKDMENVQTAVANLVEKIVDLNKKHVDLNLSFLDHLGTYSDGDTLADTGFTQPPKNAAESILQETTEQKPNLRVGRAEVARESDTTVEIHLTARYKPEDEDSYETDQWGYTETELLPALRITDFTEAEADLIKAFIPVAVDEAGGFAGFRETATKTNSLVDRLRKLTLPAIDDVRDGLESYVKTKERAEELEEKIERTDDHIDQIVYELYGLTDEEIEIVEEAVGR